MATYTILGKGNFGPAHPLFDPRVTVYVEGVAVHTAASGKEGHLWAIERGYTLPEDHPLLTSDRYQALLAEVRHRNL